jgi:MFS family permease
MGLLHHWLLIMGITGPSAVTPPLQFSKRQFAGLMIGSSVGSLFEWYDFYLAAAAAAVVWPKIFFPPRMDPALALATSVASVGIAYLARPLGAAIFGHIGDKYGRRTTLVGTMMLMGLSSGATGLLPPYVSWGVAAVVVLFLLRILIGIGIGGEIGGAYSWIVEARPSSKNRGFWVSWPSAILCLGKLLSVFVFFIVAASVSNAAWLDWGWRIPFLIGLALMVVAVVVRIKLLESPMFQQLRTKRAVLKYPAFQLLKAEWRKVFKMLWFSAFTISVPALVILPYSVSYLVALGMPESFSTMSVTVGTAVGFFMVLAGGYMSDYLSRLRVFRAAALLTILVMYPFFWLLSTIIPIWIIAAQVLIYGVIETSAGALAPLLAESFPTKYRASGAGLTYQLGGFVSGILVAFLLPALLLTYGVVGSWQPIAWVSIALTILVIATSYFVKETKGITLE